MNKKPNIIAIIPARGGSKSVPRKNIRLLNRKPLIYYAIKEAQKSKYLHGVFVSTEDRELAEIAKGYGTEVVPRPVELAQDDTPPLPVYQQVIEHLEEVGTFYPDVIVILQPTSPLRTVEDIDDAIEELLRIHSKIINSDVPENMEEIKKALAFAEMSENDGLLGNIKGDLFEIMVGFIYRSKGYDVSFKKNVIDEKEQEYEIDIVAKKGQTCLLIECKGRTNMREDEHLAEIERHFKDRTRTAALPYGWNITEEYENVYAIYITTSTEDYIPDSYKKAVKNYGIICSVIDKKGVENLLLKTNKELKNIIKKYYC